MTKLDWKKSEDYAYVDGLDNQGWAWEFIRRGNAYREAVSNDITDPSAWGLQKFYNPDQAYHEEIRFSFVSKFPVFFGFPGITIDPDTEGERVDFPELEGMEALEKFSLRQGGGNVVLIAFDAALPIQGQIEKASDFLNFHQERLTTTVKDNSKFRKDIWPRYLRMLDAEIGEDNDMPTSYKIKIIEPQKNWEGMDDNRITDYASQVRQDARAMAEYGYRKLIRRIQFNVPDRK